MNWIKTNLRKQRLQILGNETSLLVVTAFAGLLLTLN
jgi:hypothetical protein